VFLFMICHRIHIIILIYLSRINACFR
jgi:hypothetical protein